MKYACATAKTAANDPRALTAARALRMATVEGRARNREPETGSIEVGKRADLITVKQGSPISHRSWIRRRHSSTAHAAATSVMP